MGRGKGGNPQFFKIKDKNKILKLASDELTEEAQLLYIHGQHRKTKHLPLYSSPTHTRKGKLF